MLLLETAKPKSQKPKIPEDSENKQLEKQLVGTVKADSYKRNSC